MYRKEIIYTGLYRNDSRVGSAGFLKVENRERESRLCLKVQNIPLGVTGRFPVRVYSGAAWKELSSVTIQDGGGSWEEKLSESVDGAIIQIRLSGGYTLEGKSRTAPEKAIGTSGRIEQSAKIPGEAEETGKAGRQESDAAENSAETQEEQDPREEKAQEQKTAPESRSQAEAGRREGAAPEKTVIREQPPGKPEAIVVTEELPRQLARDAAEMSRSMPDHSLKEDKWEQILSTYEQIHPYGDERVYVKLEPKDFVILQSKYQHLVNNSFLLHGFYNYRYVILGKESDYYLGVPGVFYEREKMVAQMFGFEAFECPGGEVKAGEFGYYLRRVEL